MKVLTAEQMREVDRLTIERGIPGIILMENAGSRVVDFLKETFTPLERQRIVIVCGKGNNGGDGFVIARQLFSRRLCPNLSVAELFPPESLTGDAAESRKMLGACGCPVKQEFRNEANTATLVIDAVLGTGLTGPPKGPALEGIRTMNELFPLAKRVAVDIPSGLPSDSAVFDGTNPTAEFFKTDYTVTFTALKRSQAMSPSYERMGRLVVVPIGTPAEICETNPAFRLNLTTENNIRHLFGPRPQDSNKGMYGHVVVVGGSFGKSGAPSMTSWSVLASGAGLVTAAVPESILPLVASVRPEIMTVPLAAETILDFLKHKTVLALGPGLGMEEAAVGLVKELYREADLPAVVDADALNALAGCLPKTDRIRILTPHPGEMARLVGTSVKEVQADRLGAAEKLAGGSGATIVLKGDRTVIAFPDGEIWINPTGSPSMATGGTGDILTGMIAGIVGQHPQDWKRAVIAAVWLHGRSGQLAAEKLGEQCTLATDLIHFLPAAMDEVRPAV